MLLLTTISFSVLSQTHRYVDPSGSDSGNCSSPGSPCQTINYATGQSVTNDIINLSEGTFSSATLSTRVTLSGRGAGTIVQGIVVSAATSGTDLVFIENLTVSSSSANGVSINASYVNLENVNSSNHSSRNVFIDAGSLIQNVTISNCVLDGGIYGIWISDQTDLDGLTVLNTTMDSNTIGFYSSLGNSSTMDTRTSNVLFRNCTFNNNLRKGIYAEKLENAVFENITVDNSGTDPTYAFNNGIDINLKWQAYSNITIRNSRITNCGVIGSNDIGTAPENRRSSAVTIKARTDAGSYNGTPASLTTVTLDGVIIDGEVTDLRFGEMGKTDNDGIDMSTVTVQHCSIANDNLAGLINEENTNTLTIANNYWGGAAPAGTDIEDYGTSATTSQSGELANEIVDALNNSYISVADALAVGGTIQNLPAGTVSGTSTISQTTTLIAPGAGNLHSGSLTSFETLNISGADLTLGSDIAVSSGLDISSTRNLLLDNYNLLLSGTISGTGEVTGSTASGLYISGSGSLGTVLFTGGAREVERLEINRSAGSITLGSDLTVASLSLTEGIVSTGANNLFFNGNTTLAGNDNSFINGNFVYTVSGTPVGNTLLFPLGITEYRPISVEGIDQSATTNFTGFVTESAPPSSSSFSGSSLLNKLADTRYWTITPSAANVTGLDLLVLTYGDAENVSDQANIRIAQFQGSNWFNLGGSGASPVSSAASPPNAIDLSLGDFALGDETSGTNFTEIATVFVNASTGDDANDGASSGTPKQTLTAGFNLVQSGGTINIAAGSYGETIEINQPVTIVGTGSPTTTSITLNADISTSGFEASTVNVGATGIVQDGIDLVAVSGTVNVASGTYGETLTISKALTLNGANAGIAGNNAGRGVESIIEPSSAGIGITISSSDVSINGFQFGTDNATSNNTTGISSAGNTNLVISNNEIFANGAGLSVTGASSGAINVSDNSIEMLDLEDPLNAAVPSFGMVIQSITGTADADFTDNDIRAASYGIFGYDLTATPTVTIDGGLFSGCTKGIEINNADGGGGFSPSTVNIQNATMSGFTGPDPDLTFPDAQAGIYSFVGSAAALDDVTLSITNVDVSEVGNTASDYSAIYMAGFATSGSGSELNAAVSNSNIHDNLNRGIYVRGETATLNVDQSIISGNGFNPFGAGGNPGFSVIARVSASATVTNCTISNAASQTSDITAGLASDAATLTVTDCSITNNGNGSIATGLGGTLDLSRNWFGSTDESTIVSLITTPTLVDFTPAIGSGTDTDLVTSGFQPDLSTLYIGTSGTQSGGTGRWQEGHNLVDASGTVIIAHADYAETVTVSKSLTFQPTTSGTDTSLDNLVMNGSGETLTLDGNLLIDNLVTLTDGIVNVNSGELRLGSSASGLVETLTSYVSGRVTMDPRAVGIGAISMLGVSIDANAADDLGNVTIIRNMGPTAIVVDGPNSSIGISWDISVDNQPVNAGRNVIFTWLSAFDNGKDMTMVSAFRNDGSGWTEEAGPFDVSALTPRVLTVTGVTGFSEWTMAQDDEPLPVELTGFNAKVLHDAVELGWSTMTEINSDYFEIQKSKDGTNFSKAGEIRAFGNSSEQIDYSWRDNGVNVTNSFYRLKIVDLDGSFEYSNVVLAQQVLSAELEIYPNPASETVNVMYINPNFEYELYNQSGKLIGTGEAKDNKLNVSTLRKGTYFLRVDGNELARFLKD